MENGVRQNSIQLLKEIGPGRMSNTAYDTAWVARLGEIDKTMSDAALDWICENQLPDGSWGAAMPVYYHDRLTCTLAAMIALGSRGRRLHDRRQVERGLEALERMTSGATKGLMANPSGATVGFEMIVPTLLAEAEAMGIVKNQSERILGRISRQRASKLAYIKDQMISRHVTMAHSAEMAGPDATRLLYTNDLQEVNGSVANSPSATAYFAKQVSPGNEAALKYLKSVAIDGGVPNVAPFEVFERVWVIWNFSLAQQMDEEVSELCQPHIEYLSKTWRAGRGVGFAADYTPTDGDDTAVTYELLARFGRAPDTDAIFTFENSDHFRCFQFESDPSVSANIHVLAALRYAGLSLDHPAVQKVIGFLKRVRIGETYWADKWHISPYYATAHAVIACTGYLDDLAKPAAEWLVNSQNLDGSWGFYMPTAEETAYCLQALAIWNRTGHVVPTNTMRNGQIWLSDHWNSDYPALWIGKCLYTPDRVVRSTVLSALDLAAAY